MQWLQAGICLAMLGTTCAMSGFKLGVLSPQSGKWVGKDSRFEGGLQYWLDTVNAKGGVLLKNGTRLPVVLVRGDTQSNNEAAYNRTLKMVRDNSVDILLTTWVKQNEAVDRALYENDFKRVHLKCGGGLQYMHARFGDLDAMVPWTRFSFVGFLDGGDYFNGLFSLAMKKYREGVIPNKKAAFFYDSSDATSKYLCTRAMQEASTRGLEFVSFQDQLVDAWAEDAATNRTAQENIVHWVRRMKEESVPVQLIIACAPVGGGATTPGAVRLLRALHAERLDVAAIGTTLGSSLMKANFMEQFQHRPDNNNVSEVEYVLSGTQWDPLQFFPDNGKTSMGSSWEFAANITARFNKPADSHFAGCPALLTVLEQAIATMNWDSFDRDTSNEILQARMRDASVETFYGSVRFDQLNMNAGRDPTMIQVVPNEGTVQISTGSFGVPSVLPEHNSGRSIVMPMPTWEAREGCRPGRFLDETVCAPCPPHRFTNQKGSTTCTLCPAGREQSAFGQTDCDLCPAGMAREEGVLGGCSSCEPGRFMPEPGARSCKPCLGGNFSDKLGSLDCQRCKPGTFINVIGATECLDCDEGYFNPDTGATLCRWCEKGDFNDMVGQTACAPCVDNLTTMGVASNTPHLCVCQEGYFLPMLPSSDCQSCGTGLQCSVGSKEANIHSGAFSSFDNLEMHPYPKVKQKFYTKEELPLSVYECKSEDRCPGGAPGTCAPGHEGLACGICSQGFYTDFKDSCVSCGLAYEYVGGAALWLLPILLLPITWIMAKRERGDVETWGRPQYAFLGTVTILLMFTQTIAFNHILKIDLPVGMKVYASVNYQVVDLMSTFRLECSGLRDFSASYAFKLFLPVYYFIICVIVFAMSKIAEKRFAFLGGNFQGFSSLYGNAASALYLSILAQTLSIFMCYHHPNGEYSVRMASHMLCGSPPWAEMVILSLAAMALFAVPFFTVVGWVLYTAPKRFGDKAFRLSTRFIFMKFRPGREWWSIVLLIKGMVITFATVLFVDPVIQLVWMISGLMLYGALLSRTLPWRFLIVSLVDVVAHMSAIVVFVSSSFFAGVDESAKDAFGTFALVVSILVYAVSLGFCLWMYCRHGEDEAQMNMELVTKVQNAIDSLVASDIAAVCRNIPSMDFEHLADSLKTFQLVVSREESMKSASKFNQVVPAQEGDASKSTGGGEESRSNGLPEELN